MIRFPYYHGSSAKAAGVKEAGLLSDRGSENHRPKAGLLQLRPLQSARAATGGAFAIMSQGLADLDFMPFGQGKGR